MSRSTTVLVTGATSGLGRETALALARKGCEVLVHGRDPARVADITRQAGLRAHGLVADLSSRDGIAGLAAAVRDSVRRLDVLLNNAGAYMPQRRLTGDGLETTFMVNHLAPFLLSHLLLGLLEGSAPSRIVTVSSIGHYQGRVEWDNLQGERRYDAYDAYALSKLGNVLFTVELAARLAARGSGITAVCLHPGTFDTAILRAVFPSYPAPDPREGAAMLVHVATAPEIARYPGAYFSGGIPTAPHPCAQDAGLRARFWEVSARLCNLEATLPPAFPPDTPPHRP